jgi:hypothetical protein
MAWGGDKMTADIRWHGREYKVVWTVMDGRTRVHTAPENPELARIVTRDIEQNPSKQLPVWYTLMCSFLMSDANQGK